MNLVGQSAMANGCWVEFITGIISLEDCDFIEWSKDEY